MPGMTDPEPTGFNDRPILPEPKRLQPSEAERIASALERIAKALEQQATVINIDGGPAPSASDLLASLTRAVDARIVRAVRRGLRG
jgi:hypothetical protein